MKTTAYVCKPRGRYVFSLKCSEGNASKGEPESSLSPTAKPIGKARRGAPSRQALLFHNH